MQKKFALVYVESLLLKRKTIWKMDRCQKRYMSSLVAIFHFVITTKYRFVRIDLTKRSVVKRSRLK